MFLWVFSLCRCLIDEVAARQHAQVPRALLWPRVAAAAGHCRAPRRLLLPRAVHVLHYAEGELEVPGVYQVPAEAEGMRWCPACTKSPLKPKVLV